MLAALVDGGVRGVPQDTWVVPVTVQFEHGRDNVGDAVLLVHDAAEDTQVLPRTGFTAATDALAAQFGKVEVPEADAVHRAALLIIAAEGAVLIARAQRSTEPLLLVAEQFTNSPA